MIPQLEELGPSTGYNLGTTNRFDPDLERPYANEMNVEIERQLPGNIVVAAGYFHRDRKRNIGRRNMAIPMESYTPITVTERASGREVTVYNQSAALRGKFDVLVYNAPENDTTYNGVDVTFNKRLAANWMMMGGLSVSKNTGRQDQNLDLNDPNIQNSDGAYMNDVPVSFKLAGIYEFPYGIKFSGTFQHFTGFPEDITVLVTSSTIALTQVSQSIRVEPRADNRLPDTNLLDISLKKVIRIGRYAVEPGMDIFNTLNAAPIPTPGRPTRDDLWPPQQNPGGSAREVRPESEFLASGLGRSLSHRGCRGPAQGARRESWVPLVSRIAERPRGRQPSDDRHVLDQERDSCSCTPI